MSEKLDILHVAGAVGRRAYGVGTIVRALVKSQRSLGPEVSIWSNDDPTEAAAIRHDEQLLPHGLVTFPVIGPLRYSFSPALERATASDKASRFSLLHSHCVWPLCTRATMHWRDRFRRPTLITPHGELDPFMLRNRSRIKKAVVRRLYVRRYLAEASCLHAGGENEVTAIRDFGLDNPVAVIPNGVSRDWVESSGDAGRFRDRFQLPQDRRLLLYLSRVTPKKGLPLLFEAISDLRREMADWTMLVAGPDEFGHLGELKQLAASLEIEHLVRFVGPLFGPDRRDAFAAAEAFVLPTHGEGNPLVVLEAAGVGLPVLTTQAAPCDYLDRHDCGWWTKVDVASIREALRDVLDSSGARLVQMGARGSQHIRGTFMWSSIADETLRLYRWLLGQNDRPDFVIVD